MGRPKKLPHHDHYRDYTLEELNRITTEVCIKHKCPYLSTAAIGSTVPGKMECTRFMYTGKRMGCMPDECKHYEEKAALKTPNEEFSDMLSKPHIPSYSHHNRAFDY